MKFNFTQTEICSTAMGSIVAQRINEKEQDYKEEEFEGGGGSEGIRQS